MTEDLFVKLIVLASWTMVTLFLKAPGPWLLPGIIDLALAGFVITAAVKKGRIFPTTDSACAQSIDKEPIGRLFKYLAVVAINNSSKDDDTATDPNWQCQDYQGEWSISLVIW